MSIRFKTFINALCESVAAASENLNNRGSQFVERFFEKKSESMSDGNDAKSVYTPKTVLVKAPVVNDDDGQIISKDIDVPLLSLTSHSSNKIEKFTLKLNLQLYVEDEELMIDLSSSKHKVSDTTGYGNLEITISPDENADGLEQLIDNYTNVIINQIQ